MQTVTLTFNFVPAEIAPDFEKEAIDLMAKKYGHCPKCNKWFKKNRRDQVFCNSNCKHAAASQKQRDKRKMKGIKNDRT